MYHLLCFCLFYHDTIVSAIKTSYEYEVFYYIGNCVSYVIKNFRGKRTRAERQYVASNRARRGNVPRRILYFKTLYLVQLLAMSKRKAGKKYMKNLILIRFCVLHFTVMIYCISRREAD